MALTHRTAAKNQLPAVRHHEACLGLSGQVKGWKALPPDAMAEKLKTDKDLPRWQVPGQVLKERGVCTAICGVYDLLLRLDQICFSDWTINCSTPSTVLVAFFTYQGLAMEQVFLFQHMDMVWLLMTSNLDCHAAGRLSAIIFLSFRWRQIIRSTWFAIMLGRAATWLSSIFTHQYHLKGTPKSRALRPRNEHLDTILYIYSTDCVKQLWLPTCPRSRVVC